MIDRERLLASLSAAVPLRAVELLQTPLRKLLAEGAALARTIADSAEVLQLGNGRDGAAAVALDGLARALAILSFLSDGVKFCGVCFRNVHPDAAERR